MNRFYKAAGAALVLSPLSAFAAVPADVSSALDTLKADGVTMGTVVLVAIVAVFAIKFLRKGI